MAEALRDASSISVDVRNIGGISDTSVELSPGITALVGGNASNKTSFVQAVAAALGADFFSLKGDADRGEVTMRVEDQRYTRKLRRENGTVTAAGEPVLEDPELVELYAVLTESNEVRRAIRSGGDLRELLLRPLDTAEISNRIADLVAERREVDAELDRLDDLETTLEELETQRERHRAELEELESELADRRETLREAEADAPEETALAEKRDSLRERRSQLEAVEADIEIERKSLASLRENRTTIETELESVAAPDQDRLSTVEERLETLRARKRSLESVIRELQTVIRFNNERLDESESALLTALREGVTDDSVAAGLDPSERTTTCWTCGSEVSPTRIDGMVDTLQELRREKSAERNRIEAEIDDLTAELESLETAREQRASLEARLEDVTAKIDDREDTLDRLERRREELREDIEHLEADIGALQEDQQDELLDLQATVSELEFERDRVQDRLKDVEADIEGARAELEARERLEARREALSEEIRDLRTRIDRLESEAVEAFNTHMAAIVDRLEYDNIDRVWLERTETVVADDGTEVAETVFEVHVVRETDEGKAYEDSIDHLSESERELVGLVVALAGYLVHDVDDSAPFMLLDSLEMVDGERLVELVDYLESFVSFLVVVLLPDHADAFDRAEAPSHQRIVDI